MQMVDYRWTAARLPRYDHYSAISSALTHQVDPEELKGICEVLKEQGVTAVVISACYSPIDQDIKQEEQVRDIAQAILPNARITISKDVAHIGMSLICHAY